MNFFAILIAFLAGFGITWLLSVRKVTREVPVTRTVAADRHDGAAAGLAGAAGAGAGAAAAGAGATVAAQSDRGDADHDQYDADAYDTASYGTDADADPRAAAPSAGAQADPASGSYPAEASYDGDYSQQDFSYEETARAPRITEAPQDAPQSGGATMAAAAAGAAGLGAAGVAASRAGRDDETTLRQPAVDADLDAPAQPSPAQPAPAQPAVAQPAAAPVDPAWAARLDEAGSNLAGAAGEGRDLDHEAVQDAPAYQPPAAVIDASDADQVQRDQAEHDHGQYDQVQEDHGQYDQGHAADQQQEQVAEVSDHEIPVEDDAPLASVTPIGQAVAHEAPHDDLHADPQAPQVAAQAQPEYPEQRQAQPEASDRPASVVCQPGDPAPVGYSVKGDRKAHLYLVPDDPDFQRARPDIWFLDEQTALEAGYKHYVPRQR